MMEVYHVGVDPGINGAVALFRGDHLLAVRSLPIINLEDGKKPRKSINRKGEIVYSTKTRNVLDISKLNSFIDLSKVTRCFIEDVHSSPMSGVVSSFNFGFSTGLLHGFFLGRNITVIKISPVEWKQNLGLTKDKELSRKLATEKFPEFGDIFSRKNDRGAGRCEAVLIGYYGNSKFSGKNGG